MTQEQQTKLEQLASDYGNRCMSTASTDGFEAGAQTILDNPQEWDLVRYEDYLKHSKRTLSENERYREALESIANAEDLGIEVDPLGIALLMKKRAKEALKNVES